MLEIDQRTNGGITVTLLWNKDNDVTLVSVWTDEEGFELEVPKALALDAYNHPYAYRAEYECYAAAVA